MVGAVDDISPEAADLHGRALGPVYALRVRGQSSVGRVVARQARLEGHAGEAELLVVEPIDDPSLWLYVRLVVKVHQVLPVVKALSVVATASLLAQGLDVKGHVLPPPLEDILEHISVPELQVREVDHRRQRVHGVVGDQLDKLWRDIRHIGDVPLAYQRVPVDAQKRLHALADGKRRVVDDLQEEEVPRQHLVVALVQEETQTTPLSTTLPAREGLHDMPKVGAAGDEDVHRVLWQRRRLRLRLGLLLTEVFLVGHRLRVLGLLLVRLLVDLSRGGAYGGGPEGLALRVVPQKVQRGRVAPELDEAHGVSAIRSVVLGPLHISGHGEKGHAPPCARWWGDGGSSFLSAV
mmetsp:Transcript_67041/g.196057  ORF Transcript_67041/g.196057 Transcript_67041/m.196057 type:complete len:350 (+) Transcript_67041:809-1858(+)